jgi:hypothetical protein
VCSANGAASEAWITWYEDDGDKVATRANSTGAVRDGVLLPPTQQWWRDGVVASLIEDDTLTIWNEAGSAVWAVHPVVDGVPVACPAGATAKDEALPSGHRSRWCEVIVDGEAHKVGLQTTFYVTGSLESRQLWVRPADGGGSARQGTFLAWHASGARWIQGEFLKGKRHGTWMQWGVDGNVFQQSSDPEWADTKPLASWYDERTVAKP